MPEAFAALTEQARAGIEDRPVIDFGMRYTNEPSSHHGPGVSGPNSREPSSGITRPAKTRGYFCRHCEERSNQAISRRLPDSGKTRRGACPGENRGSQ